MGGCNFIGGGIDFIDQAAASSEVNSAGEQARGAVNLGAGIDLPLHGMGIKVEYVEILVRRADICFVAVHEWDGVYSIVRFHRPDLATGSDADDVDVTIGTPRDDLIASKVECSRVADGASG